MKNKLILLHGKISTYLPYLWKLKTANNKDHRQKGQTSTQELKALSQLPEKISEMSFQDYVQLLKVEILLLGRIRVTNTLIELCTENSRAFNTFCKLVF